MKINKFIIHIGIPKTATTSMQNNIFMALHERGDVFFLGKSGRSSGLYFPIKDLIGKILTQSDFVFNRDIDIHRNELTLLTANVDESLPIVISEEALVVPNYSDQNITNPAKVAFRLSELMQGHKVDVLLTIRNQCHAIYSWYAQLCQSYPSFRNGDVSYELFVLNGVVDKQNGYLAFFYYASLIDAYSEFFHIDNIHVLLYESLESDLNAFYYKLDRVLNVMPGRSKGLMENAGKHNIKQKTDGAYIVQSLPVGMKIKYYLISIADKMGLENYLRKLYRDDNNCVVWLKNVLHAGAFSNIRVGGTKTISPQSNEVLREIGIEFSHENRRINHLFNGELESYGYPL